ncbi:MAG: DUF2961 domain-containing protein [Candidatus Bipolaricaulis sp.]|nr:DUF2961 domain-containing protein [Candidatus Bipolaricaulis sp.]
MIKGKSFTHQDCSIQNKNFNIWIIGIGVLMYLSRINAQENISYIDLVKKLIDLESLAVLPANGEKCSQWSSYDRSSKYDEKSDQYIDWSANADENGFIREENGEYVLAEMEGPGVIWRIWSAKAGSGNVKIFLDGNTTPVVDLPFYQYFNCENEPFNRPALVHQTARGSNCYVPIPYQKSCKITAEPDWGAYYHFTYTTYPKGTNLPTFKRELSVSEAEALDRADEKLLNCGDNPVKGYVGEITKQKSVGVSPGKTKRVIQIDGKYAITSLKVKVDIPESQPNPDVLRELALSIYWDDESIPSVWAPLGDFFGTAPGGNIYKSLPMGMIVEGFYSNWYMPFEKKAVIRLTNDGDKDREVLFLITYAPLKRPIQELGRFHAKWHRDAFLPDRIDRWPDWTLLTTAGRGRFCGTMLHVWNPKGEWWGEGDEKFFIDGEKFPSTFGTGSEDYFGYAWCDPTLFSNCYHNQTVNTNNCGHISVNRWHITDNVPFMKSFEGVIEKYFNNKTPTLYASIVYWYLAPGGVDPYEPVPIKQRIDYCTIPPVFKVENALEGENLKVIKVTNGKIQQQKMHMFGSEWSGDTQLWWTGANPGDVLELSVPVMKTGKYKLEIQLTKAADYGVVQLHLDGKELEKPIDLYSDKVVPVKIQEKSGHKLEKGEHILGVEIIGVNQKSIKGYMFGIDYLLLKENI